MEIKNIGYNYKHPNTLIFSRPNGTNDYVFLLLKSPFYIRLNGRLIHSPSSAVIIYDKNTPHWYHGDESSNFPFANDFFHFVMNEDDMRMITELNISFNTLYKLDDISFFSQTIKQLCYEYNTNNVHKDKIIQLYVKLLFTKLSSITQTSLPKELNQYYNSFLLLRTNIINHPMREWDIDRIAQSMSLSRSRFQHLYKDFFNCSMMSDVIRCRMERAQYLLYSSPDPISTIAEHTGYDNVSCFTRQFKKVMGITPSQYRKIVRQSVQSYKRDSNYDIQPQVQASEANEK